MIGEACRFDHNVIAFYVDITGAINLFVYIWYGSGIAGTAGSGVIL
jgi:hypothetical protein